MSDEVLALADGCALVPMLGFVDSYNVSVAAALTLYEARCGRCAVGGSVAAAEEGDSSTTTAAEGPAANPGLLSEHERSVLLAVMLLRQTVRSPSAARRSPHQAAGMTGNAMPREQVKLFRNLPVA